MYYVVYGLLWLVSLLPLRILYFISDLVYGLMFYIIGYRRKVVMENLRIVFPEIDDMQRTKIAKQFYRNLIDTFIESIKMITAPFALLEKRVSFNIDEINRYYQTGRNMQIHIGHNFNWEWANAVFAKKTPFTFLGVYMPIANKIFNRLFYKLRSSTGTVLISAKNMREEYLPHRNKQYVLGLAADQSPGHPANAWWFNFFGRLTPFVKGPAKGAVTNNTIVVFAYIHKPRRGYYDVEFKVAHENPEQLTEQELTRMFVRYLEQVIAKYPEMWLWSHRRWKHEWKPEYGEVVD